MTRAELLQEAYSRGILPENQRLAYEEALRRGLIPGVAPSSKKELSWSDVPIAAAKNFIPSAKRAAGELVDAVVNYEDTGEALSNLAVGTGQKVWRNLSGGNEVGDKEMYVDAVGKYFADRYGNMDGFKRALAYDPVGVLSDMSTVFTGAGGALNGAGSVAKAMAGVNRRGLDVANALKKTGAAASKVAEYTDPLGLAAHGVMGATNYAMGKEFTPAQKVYQSALGLNTGFSNNSKARFSPEEILRMTREGVDNRIPVTTSGWKKAGDTVWDINNRIDQAIDATDAAGIKVDPMAIAVRALESDARKQIAAGNTPARDLKAFDNALDEYLRFHGNDTSLRSAQESKKATYRQNEKRYQNNAAPVASGRTEAGMELASQQRQAIADAVDYARNNGIIEDTVGMRLHDLNAKEGANIALRDAIERAVLKAGNKGAIDYLTGGLAAATTGDLGTGLAVGAGKQILTSPGVRSKVAFTLDNLQKYGELNGLQRPALATMYGVGVQDDIQDWYRQKYGGLLGYFAK